MVEMIRDFLYLDVERLRSFSAQLLEGVPESRIGETSHEIGGGTKGEAGLFGFLKAQGELDYRYHRSGSETRSLHHHVYVLFEQALDLEGFLRAVEVEFDHDSWEEDTFADGEFVRIRGAVQLTDHSRIIARLQSVPKLVDSMQKLTAGTARIGSEESKAKSAGLAQQYGAMAKDAKSMPFNQLGSLGDQLYDANEFRLKVRPEGAPLAHIFVGQCRHESLVDASVLMTGMHRSPEGAGWIVVGQVTASADHAAGELMATGNSLDDNLETMAMALGNITNVVAGVMFPARQIVPVAVYREIGSRR